MQFSRDSLRTILVAGALSVLAPLPSHAQTAGGVVGTIVRFSNGANQVDVTIGEDNPTVRDFLSRLPLTMPLEEYAGREKIGYFEPKLAIQGSPGSDPEDGDLIYFVPWGNFGFYYNASGIGYSDQTIHLGTYNATREELSRLEGAVTIAIAR